LKISTIYFLVILFRLNFFGTFIFAQNNCKLRKDEDGIKVYTCHVDSSKFKSILTEFDIACPEDKLIEKILDIPGYVKWQFNTIEGKEIRTISSREKIYRTVIAAPWPVVNRDMVVHLRIYNNENGIVITTDSESGIVEEQPDLVRVPFSRAQWIVTTKNKNQLHVKYTMLIDPGGAVPAWLVNWTCANAPLQSFQNLKKLIEQK
jgi:hypothetical protein